MVWNPWLRTWQRCLSVVKMCSTGISNKILLFNSTGVVSSEVKTKGISGPNNGCTMVLEATLRQLVPNHSLGYYRPQRSFYTCLWFCSQGGVSVPACTTGHMTRGVSVQGVSVLGALCPGGVCPGGLCPGGGLCSGGLCPGGSLLGSPPPRRNERAVRILLECIIVYSVRFRREHPS